MLDEYNKKRDFSRTSEPSPAETKGEGDLIFVIQKHAARRLHYDFRLELDGVLKSWAVPQGPSLDPRVKRLAVAVEDHPLDYASFEGTIPEGEYGAGQVIVWDRGVYSPDKDGQLFFGDRDKAQQIVRETLPTGKLKVSLRGSRLNGSFALVKMQHRTKEWLLMKHKDEFASDDDALTKHKTSVSSGLSIEGLKAAGKRPAGKHPPGLENLAGSHKADFPTTISPMLATPAKKAFSDPEWLFEPKLDGYRVLAFINDGRVKLISRNGIDVTGKYTLIAAGLAVQQADEAVLDGEMIALDENGRPCFQCLQNHLNAKKTAVPPVHPIIYYVFDVLYLNGYDLLSVPLSARKRVLETVFSPSDHVRLVEYVEKDGKILHEAALKSGMEGVIAKKMDSLYEPGQRSQSWLKIKPVMSDEFVIGGYTKGAGNRTGTFGALLLGNYNVEGDLVFAGHVGTGFDQKLLAGLKKRLDALHSDRSPFAENPVLNQPANWVRPELVAEIKFAERTQDGILRMPVFLRLREDKSPSEVGQVKFISKGPSPDPARSPVRASGRAIEDILEQLADPKNSFTLKVDSFKIGLSNLDKVLWPARAEQKKITKRDLLTYLARVSPYILPHLHNRPLTLTRYPNGIEGKLFFQKHLEKPVPEFLETVSLAEHKGEQQDYLLCNNLASLLWLGQMANIDIHTWFSRTDEEPVLTETAGSEKKPDFFTSYPDFIVFDLDPYIYSGVEAKGAEPELNRKAFQKTGEVAMELKDVLDGLKFYSFLKTSGRTGLHVYVPLLRQFDYHSVHSAARTICEFLFKKRPQDVTLEWAVARRAGKVFLDYNQNVRGKTLASIYSPRSSPFATVSTPLLWEEIGKTYPTDFTILTVPGRLAKTGDLWVDILDRGSDLKNLLGIGKES